MKKLTIKDVELDNKKVFLRVDFNVPLTDGGEVADDTRIKAALPTIKYLIDKGATLIISSHLGRPDGEVKEELRLDSVAAKLSDLLGLVVYKADLCSGEKLQKIVEGLTKGDLLLLENIRFHPGEKKNDLELAKEWASMADLYVNDAFGTAHRAHASTEGITKYLPAVAGLLMEKELDYLEKVIESPTRPLLAILGGAKVSDKIEMIDKFIDMVDVMLIGGGMANTFLKAAGNNLGKSLLENDKLELAQRLMRKAKEKGVSLLLPKDVVGAKDLKPGIENKSFLIDSIPDDYMALDIGETTVQDYIGRINQAETIFWNGPLGAFEVEPFDKGTVKVAQAVAASKAVTVVGGGDVVAALMKNNLTENITHVSTGGGATLEFLQGKELPGVAALKDREG